MRNSLFVCVWVCAGVFLAGCDPKTAADQHQAANSIPCDFKGVSVGDKLIPAQVMRAYNVNQWKQNPTHPTFDQMMEATKKYGIIPSAEEEDEKLGSFCENQTCNIPFGINVGNNNTPVKVTVGWSGNIVSEIDVSFTSTEWDDLLPIIKNKYGNSWSTEEDPSMYIMDQETKQGLTVDRFSITSKVHGANEKTGDRCEFFGTNFDIIEMHHDALGPYHGNFIIRLISKNF